MSLSLESMEIVRRTTSNGVLSVIKPRRLNTMVIGFITIGQLVGSSGGIIFLAEFVVTAISLLLGGAATITSRTIDAWITFFCLSSTAFWGFVFARLGLLDGMRKKRCGIPSALLCASLCSAMTMWVIVLTHVDWYSLSPGSLIVAQAREMVQNFKKRRAWFILKSFAPLFCYRAWYKYGSPSARELGQLFELYCAQASSSSSSMSSPSDGRYMFLALIPHFCFLYRGRTSGFFSLLWRFLAFKSSCLSFGAFTCREQAWKGIGLIECEFVTRRWCITIPKWLPYTR